MRENVHQPGHSANQAEQWRNSHNDFENDETSLQSHHLVTRTGLHHFNIFRPRPAHVLQRQCG